MTTYTLHVKLHSYIAHPYWPERERVINIIKESGMSRARSSANRRKALEEYLKSTGMTLEQYDELVRLAERPFYTTADGEIIVPELHVISMVVAVCDSIRAAGRPIPPDQVRSAVTVSPWRTGKTGPDGVWERFAVVTAGTGARLSNQRALRSNPYIKDTMCTGTMDLNERMVRPEVFWRALEWGGANIGIGASRKMGWGRFTIVSVD